MSITRQEFNRQCIKFVSRCRDFNDRWSLIYENSGELYESPIDEFESREALNSRLMLAKSEILTKVSNVIQTSEYSVLFSESYEVPIMYFCVSNQDGSPLSLDHIIARPASFNENELGQIINQVEHPTFFRPFFMIHPCRTKKFMEPHVRIHPCNYLICWLSTVGTLLGLKLDARLAESIGIE